MNIKGSLHVYLNKKEGRIIEEKKQHENNCLLDLVYDHPGS
jgi:hypothetical protein